MMNKQTTQNVMRLSPLWFGMQAHKVCTCLTRGPFKRVMIGQLLENINHIRNHKLMSFAKPFTNKCMINYNKVKKQFKKVQFLKNIKKIKNHIFNFNHIQKTRKKTTTQNKIASY